MIMMLLSRLWPAAAALALAAAVWLHGCAARLAADRHRGRAPIQAADIAAEIPRVLADPERRGAHTPRR